METCPERLKGAKDLHSVFASNRSMEILRRCAPQNDMFIEMSAHQSPIPSLSFLL